jgi:2-polyprenyl-6-methoxyphenol hydroxylase-like FAD-dependent oxidoreductase
MPAMARPFDVCIRGAGIVGRALALQLASQRLRVALVDHRLAGGAAVSDGHSDVRAYALNPASRACLQELRCWPDALHATPVLAMEVFGDAGGSTRFDAAESSSEALNWIVDVPELEKLLTSAIGFQGLIEVVSSPQAAPLAVVCEGKASRTREEFGVEFIARPYAQWALAARVDCTVPHAQIARQWFSHIEGQSEILALLPLGGAKGRTCALVWSAPPERVQALQALDAQAFCLQLQAASHQVLGDMQLTSERQTWPLQHSQAAHWCGETAHGAWVLAGDAAHAVHPLAGQGLNLGLGDVAKLASVLGARPYWRSVGDVRLLRSYERARKAELALIGGAGDALQQLFSRDSAWVRSLRNSGMRAFERSGPLKSWVAQRAMGLRSRE